MNVHSKFLNDSEASDCSYGFFTTFKSFINVASWLRVRINLPRKACSTRVVKHNSPFQQVQTYFNKLRNAI